MKNYLKLLAVPILSLGMVSFAQDAASSKFLNVGTGTPTGTYSKVFKDMGKVCANSAYLRERGTAGTGENIELLLGNQVSLAFLQVDALEAKRKIEQDPRVDQIKTLIPLYPEEIHIIVRSDLSQKTGGFLGFFTKKTPITKFSQLAGKNIGAWGGSVITTRVIQAQTGVAFANIASFTGKDAQGDALSALQSGKIDAILSVAGQPVTWIRELPSGQFRLINFDMLGKLSSSLYKPSRITYANLGLEPVQTFSVLSILATRDFKTADKAKMLLKYKSCVIAKIDLLREGEGFHSKWGVVEPAATPPWPAYNPTVK